MPRVFPFEALVYDVTVAGALDRVTTPPYDVISETRRREYGSEPFSIVQVDLGIDDGDDRYRRAGALLRRWVDEGVLVRTPPAFFAYEMSSSMADTVRGVFCAMELEDWGGDVMPHEQTMAGPVEDRLRLLRATHTHLSAVYGTVGGPCPSLEDLLDDVTARPPEAELVDEQGVTHRRWTIPADVPIADWLAEEPLLIADGHHRYTTALAFRDEMRASSGPGPWDRLLTFVVDAGSEHLSVQPFHRIQMSGPLPEPGTAGRRSGRGHRRAVRRRTARRDRPTERLGGGVHGARPPRRAAGGPRAARRAAGRAGSRPERFGSRRTRRRRWMPCAAVGRWPPTCCPRRPPTGSARSSNAASGSRRSRRTSGPNHVRA